MPHCHRYLPSPLTRRDLLAQAACGFGSVALAGVMSRTAVASDALPKPHHEPKARSVIFLYMDGGVSHLDSFDPKPTLDEWNGKPFPLKKEKTQFNNDGNVLASPWTFKQYGESGIPVSELFPRIAAHADRLAVVRSMTSHFPEHTTANYFLHTGHGQAGRPSMGAWYGYGLGSECDDLPGFVVVNGGLIPPGGLDCFGSGFLPASYQGSIFASSDPPVANVKPADDFATQRRKLDLMRSLDAALLERTGSSDAIESAIANYELAARMQLAVPDLTDLSGETAETQRLYGLEADWPQTRVYGRCCLLARRLVERGVRFIELTCPGGNGDRWDQHSNLKDGHEKNAKTVDQPIAALIEDLSRRGLLDSTLLVFTGEFGRTPFAQGDDGRDHNPGGFSLWMAGGGIKGGTVYGATDEFGYKAVENRCEIHDLHATMLHLAGVDHERLTFRFSGRDMRLTDVHGRVLTDVIA
ncbi:MAG TPA: DUF1501 domain-containing protein [Planctomycetaceae bacterium]